MMLQDAHVIVYDPSVSDMLAVDTLFKNRDAAERKVRKLDASATYVIMTLQAWIRNKVDRARNDGYFEGSEPERYYDI